MKEVSVRFGSVQALDSVGLQLSQGQATLLAGPNGSGKSTLMGVLLGLVRPNAGSLEIDGRTARSGRSLKERIGYLPEAAAFAPNLSGRQVLQFFARARGVGRSRLEEVLETVRLTEAASRAVRGYSRGMLQRLGIAVAVLAEPELLILDEPTGGLDQAGLSVLWAILDEWHERNRMVLMASHDLVLMERRVDQVVMLSGGLVVASGSPVDLRRRAMLPIRVHFDMAPTSRNSELIGEIGRISRVSTTSDTGLVTEVEPDGLLALLALQPRFNGAVTGIRIEEPGFDAIYQSTLEMNP